MIIKPNIKIVREEIDSSHYYWVEGKFMPSVTRILDEGAPMPFGLKQFLLNNTPESAEEIKNIAGDFGSKMHDVYEKLLQGHEIDLFKDHPQIRAKRHIASFAQWFADFQPENPASEQQVASLKYQYAGTLDCLCEKDGEIWLIDFKTSAGIYWSYECQVVAYKQAVEETFGIKVDHCAILRTGTRHKSGYEFKEIDRPIEDFMNVYRTYLSINGGEIPEPPKMSVYPMTIKLQLNNNNVKNNK